MPVDRDFRAEATLWSTVSVWLSKTVQRFEELRSYDLTLDDAIFYDWSNSMHELARNARDNIRVT